MRGLCCASLLFFIVECAAASTTTPSSKINGFCSVGWPYASQSSQFAQSFAEMMQLNPNWVAIVEDWGQVNINSTAIYPASFTQNTSNLVAAIALAKKNNLKVALKPMVDVTNDPTHWRGEIGTYFNQSQWQAWFASYQSYMKNMSMLAQKMGVDLLLIGTELTMTEPQGGLWNMTIESYITPYFKGQIAYGANHPIFELQSWWSKLDMVGLDAYYPLTSTASPTVQEISQGWQQYIPYFEALHSQYQVPILFGELGYQSLTDTTVTPWAANGNLSLSAQANAYQAYFETIYSLPWFAGAFFWAWPSDPNAGGSQDTSFAVRDKPAAAVIQQHFSA